MSLEQIQELRKAIRDLVEANERIIDLQCIYEVEVDQEKIDAIMKFRAATAKGAIAIGRQFK
jgi:hypothetical protein